MKGTSEDIKTKIRFLWDAVADEFEQKIGDAGDIFRKFAADTMIFELLKGCNGMNVLDVGCGNGYLLPKLKKNGFMVDGLDISPNQLKHASKRAPEDSTLFEADIENINNPPSKQYDALICSFVLDGLQNLDLALQGCHSLLRCGGYLIINIPHPCFIGYEFWRDEQDIEYVIEDKQGKEIFLYKCTKPVLFFQRPLSSYLNAIARAGFIIKKICEPEEL